MENREVAELMTHPAFADQRAGFEAQLAAARQKAVADCRQAEEVCATTVAQDEAQKDNLAVNRDRWSYAASQANGKYLEALRKEIAAQDRWIDSQRRAEQARWKKRQALLAAAPPTYHAAVRQLDELERTEWPRFGSPGCERDQAAQDADNAIRQAREDLIQALEEQHPDGEIATILYRVNEQLKACKQARGDERARPRAPWPLGGRLKSKELADVVGAES